VAFNYIATLFSNQPIDCGTCLKNMACSFRGWSSSSALKSHHLVWSKLARLRSTENHTATNEAANEVTRDPAVVKNKIDAPKLQSRIKNELSYHLPTVSLPPKLENSVKEILKRERCIRIF